MTTEQQAKVQAYAKYVHETADARLAALVDDISSDFKDEPEVAFALLGRIVMRIFQRHFELALDEARINLTWSVLREREDDGAGATLKGSECDTSSPRGDEYSSAVEEP
jgi:hypothetical protein